MHLSLLPDWANTTERDTTILHLLSFRVNPIQKPVRTGQYGGGEEQEMLTYGPESYVPGDRYLNLPCQLSIRNTVISMLNIVISIW